jgi:N-methylhydantoinase A
VERSGIAPERIDRVIHATTLFTNLIGHKGAPTELITMAGFRGYAGDWPRPQYELYDLFEMPLTIVPHPWRREVPERLAPDGSVEIPLDLGKHRPAVIPRKSSTKRRVATARPTAACPGRSPRRRR